MNIIFIIPVQCMYDMAIRIYIYMIFILYMHLYKGLCMYCNKIHSTECPRSLVKTSLTYGIYMFIYSRLNSYELVYFYIF